jgi:hypothetical protein
MGTEVAYAPGWSIRTDFEVVAEPKEALALEDLHERFARPLLCLTVLASDRPDALTREVVRNPEGERWARVFREGRDIRAREWRPADPYLFTAHELPDFETALQRWFALFDTAPDVVGNVAGAINEGNVYAPARLLTVVVAAEAYHRQVQHGGGHLDRRLRELRELVGLTDEPSLCDENLSLMAASRNYYGHLEDSNYGFSASDVVDNTFASTRRATVLMQACLMHELGFDTSEIDSHLKRHYKSWPLP